MQRTRWQRWFEARLPRQDLQALSQRNVYILPSGAGWMLGLTLVLLLVASINYQLNLGYGLSFLLAGCALAGMHMAHGNLNGLRLRLRPAAPVFAGSTARISLVVHNPSRQPRHAIELGWAGQDPTLTLDLPPKSDGEAALACPCPQRGQLALPTVCAQTRFPLGSFRVWTLWRPATPLWVYPAPETPCPALPRAAFTPSPEASAQALPADRGEWDGVRSYRRGDSLHQIAWKKSSTALASGQPHWVSREAGTPAAARELWLDAQDTGLPPGEAQLSRLCAWVLLAERQGWRYGLRLPAQATALASGPAHCRHCLEVLTLC